MMSDAMGPLETRLLALERRQDRVDALLDDLRRRATAVSQGVWDAWSEASPPAVPPAAACTADFPGVCPCIPTTLTLVDSYYGPCRLTYGAATGTWTGCKLVSYPATALCPAAASTPIFYTLVGSGSTASWALRVSWVGSVSSPGGNVCPVNGASCATGPTYTKSATAAVDCGGTTTWTFAGGSQGSIYPGGVTGLLSIDFSAGASA